MKDTMDFACINYYSASFVQFSNDTFPGNFKISNLNKNGATLGIKSGTPWQTVYPKGLRIILNYVNKVFKAEIWVSECGVSGPNEGTLTTIENVNDYFRQKFYEDHLKELYDAILKDKINIKAFLAWSLFDNFEWGNYDERFGLVAIDGIGSKNGSLNRVPKNSFKYLAEYFNASISPFNHSKSMAVKGRKSFGTGGFVPYLASFIAVFLP